MSVQIVNNESIPGLWILRNHAADVLFKIGFRSGWLNQRRHDLSVMHAARGDESAGSPTMILLLDAFHLFGFGWFSFMRMLQRLNPGFLVGTVYVNPLSL